MIKAQELRIGNFVSIFGTIGRVVPSDFNPEHHNKWLTVENDEYIIKSWEPVELTPEWSERFGFEGNANDGYGLDVVELNYITTEDNFQLEYQIAGVDKWFLIQLKYVHQLQNLFFALTGHELELKK